MQFLQKTVRMVFSFLNITAHSFYDIIDNLAKLTDGEEQTVLID